MKLHLQVYQSDTPDGPPSGPVLDREEDLWMDNLGNILAALFVVVAGTANASLKDTSNIARTVIVWALSGNFWTTSAAGRGTFIAVGTGATAAARTDFALQTQVGSYATMGSAPVYTSASGTIVFAASILLAAGATVTEAGLFLDLNASGSSINFIVARDVFAGVVIAVGKFAHVTYTLTI